LKESTGKLAGWSGCNPVVAGADMADDALADLFAFPPT